MGIRTVSESKTGGTLSMEFGCMAFPKDFALPFESGEDVLRLRTEETAEGRAVVSAMRCLSPVWHPPTSRAF